MWKWYFNSYTHTVWHICSCPTAFSFQRTNSFLNEFYLQFIISSSLHYHKDPFSTCEGVEPYITCSFISFSGWLRNEFALIQVYLSHGYDNHHWNHSHMLLSSLMRLLQSRNPFIQKNRWDAFNNISNYNWLKTVERNTCGAFCIEADLPPV